MSNCSLLIRISSVIRGFETFPKKCIVADFLQDRRDTEKKVT